MTDRELLELAAKAAGIDGWISSESKGGWDEEVTIPAIFYYIGGRRDDQDKAWWNPLTDDGDALRLAVKLGLDVVFYPHCACVGHSINQYSDENYENDPNAATRRAIVRAAAAIWKESK